MNGTPSQYLKSATYTAHGAPDVMRLNGDSLRERYGYDANRLQLTSIDVESCNGTTCSTPSELLHLDFNYGTANNNGNLRDQTIRGSGLNLKQTYSYDSISRLSGFTEGPVGGANAIQETYCFDRHGNRAVLTRPGLSSMTPQVTACNEQEVLNLFPKNQIAGSVYDAGGQLKSDGRSELRFDIEERLRRTEAISGAATVYEYDGDGRRVSKQTGTATPAIFVYDAMGQLAAEYGSFAEATGVTYLHNDHLGSTRLVTDGTTSVKRIDYFPFGGELTAGDTAYRTSGALFTSGLTPTQKFTGKERDAETGLDYFGARYLASAQGRFVTPDGANGPFDRANPQSWNRYGQSFNNPTVFVDPDGRWPFWVHSDIHQTVLRHGMKQDQISRVNKASFASDFSLYGNPEFSNQHAMATRNQDSLDAVLELNAFVMSALNLAKDWSNGGENLTPDALWAFGRATHALADIGTPEHTGKDGRPVEYTGGTWELLVHSWRERGPGASWSGIGQSIRLVAAAYYFAFPKLAAKQGSFESFVRTAIVDYVDRAFSGLTGKSAGPGRGTIAQEEARQCALGNPAACQN